MKYGLKNYQKRDLSGEEVVEEWLKDIPVSDAKTPRPYESAAVNVYIKDQTEPPVLLMKEEEKIEVKAQAQEHLTAPVLSDQTVGKIQYLLNGEVLWERQICVKQGIGRVDYTWFFKMIFANFAL